PSGLYNGVARTDDGGGTWRIVHRESNTPSKTMVGSWFEEGGVMPGPDLVYVTDLFRTYRTLDGGHQWAQVHSKPVGEKGWTTRGLDVTNAYGVHADPHDANRIFISYTDIGFFGREEGR